MADAKPKTSRGGLGRKIGPLPAWAWGVIVLAVAAYFLYFRKGSGGTNAGQVSTGAPQGNAYASPMDANAGAINAAQAGQPSTASAPADMLSSDVAAALQANNSDLVTALNGAFQNAYDAGAAAYATSTGYLGSDGGAALLGAATVAAPTATERGGSVGTAGGAKVTQPFGGIVKKTKTKSGATLTYYANGRVVEQAPGKSPYVVAKGR